MLDRDPDLSPSLYSSTSAFSGAIMGKPVTPGARVSGLQRAGRWRSQNSHSPHHLIQWRGSLLPEHQWCQDKERICSLPDGKELLSRASCIGPLLDPFFCGVVLGTGFVLRSSQSEKLGMLGGGLLPAKAYVYLENREGEVL